MRMKCFNCKKEAEVGKPYISYETNIGMINFCSEECEQQCAEDQAENKESQDES